MSRHILIEPYRPAWLPSDDPSERFCAREFIRDEANLRFVTRVLHTAPTRTEVADWLARGGTEGDTDA